MLFSVPYFSKASFSRVFDSRSSWILDCSSVEIRLTKEASAHSFENDRFQELFTNRCENTKVREDADFGSSREKCNSLNPLSTRHTLQIPML